MGQLTERGVQTAKPGRHGDGDGLHLVVSEAGRKKWVLRYQVAGVRKDKGLGSYPAVGLKDARTKAAEHRARLGKGIDPIEAERAARKASRPIPTFEAVAELVIADGQKKSVNAKVRYQMGAPPWSRVLRSPARAHRTRDHDPRRGSCAAPYMADEAGGGPQALSGHPTGF
jgi:hypothetical protein